MDIKRIRKIAKEKNVDTKGMDKRDIIQSIQRVENNYQCFGTDRMEYCNEQECLWREDCLAQNKKMAV